MEKGIVPEVPMTEQVRLIFQNQSHFIRQTIDFLGGVESVSLINRNKVVYFPNTENLVYKIQYKRGFGLSSDLYLTRQRDGQLIAFFLSNPY